MKKIAADPELQKRFLVAGARCISSTPEEAHRLCRQGTGDVEGRGRAVGREGPIADGVRA